MVLCRFLRNQIYLKQLKTFPSGTVNHRNRSLTSEVITTQESLSTLAPVFATIVTVYRTKNFHSVNRYFPLQLLQHSLPWTPPNAHISSSPVSTYSDVKLSFFSTILAFTLSLNLSIGSPSTNKSNSSYLSLLSKPHITLPPSFSANRLSHGPLPPLIYY